MYPIPIDDYLNVKQDLPQEVQQEIRRMRNNPFMTMEQFTALFMSGAVKRTRKLKKPRSLFVEDDKIWFFDNYHKRYNYAGYFKSDEQLKEETDALAARKKEIEERRAEKKRLKAEKNAPVPPKPKRKRIQR